jgi:hypothetical protein
MFIPSPRHHEGRFAIVTKRGAGCDGPQLASGACTRRNVCNGRRSRVVLAPRPWRYVGAKYRAGNGGKKGRFPGESAYKPSNHSRGEGRDVLAVPVGLTRVRKHTGFATGASGARPSLRPLNRGGPMDLQSSGEKRAVRMRAHVSTRHCERSEAIQLCRSKEKLDCFVADAPRNDGVAAAGGPHDISIFFRAVAPITSMPRVPIRCVNSITAL